MEGFGEDGVYVCLKVIKSMRYFILRWLQRRKEDCGCLIGLSL